MTESAPLDPHDAQTRLRNMVLDFFYKQVRLGKSNAEILRKLQSTDLPPVSETELNALRAKFKAMEARVPEKMAQFRQVLKVP